MAQSKGKKPEHEDDDDLPMTEAQWEQMMRESDLRAARFGELLETLADDPDADKKIAREMGYDELADDLEEYDRAKAAGEIDESEIVAAANDPEIIAEMERSDAELEAMPAYRIANRAAEVVRKVLDPYKNEKDDDRGELIGAAFIGVHIAAAKIAGGHGMGYEDDALCGNIVNNKKALAGARQSLEAFEELRAQNIVPASAVEQVMPLLRECEAAIESRIAELRSRVWWDK